MNINYDGIIYATDTSFCKFMFKLMPLDFTFFLSSDIELHANKFYLSSLIKKKCCSKSHGMLLETYGKHTPSIKNLFLSICFRIGNKN